MKYKRRKCGNLAVMFLLFALYLYPALPCSASEEGLGAYWPGYRNYLAGVVPPNPGFYFRDDVVGYTATAPRVVLNGLPVRNVSANVVVEVMEPWYVSPHKIWGATHAVVLTLPVVWDQLSGNIIGTPFNPFGNYFDLGDIVISPFFLGWDKGKIHYNTNFAVFAPTGAYNIQRVANTSQNYWTFDPEFGFTYLNPRTGWDLSGALGYSINTENPATLYTSGDILHLDVSAAKTLPNGLKPGIVGYALTQVTPDYGPGAIFGSFESRVFGLGPALEWKASAKATLMLRCYFEFGATNHLQGNQYALTLRTPL